MATGTVKWLDYVKGYGFILPDDGGRDVFLHVSEVRRAGLDWFLSEGTRVRYEVREVRGKNSAVNLKTE